MYSPKLSKRLLCAANLVRPSSLVADVGSDHAYLPIYLCAQGRIRGAVASDINEGPVMRASINIASFHLDKKIKAVRADGLEGIERYSPDDVVICGMGGELIVSILSAAPWTKNEKIRLVLQPMTHAEKLRAFLNDNGYRILAEKIVKEDRIYQILSAQYCGNTVDYSPTELIFGKEELREYTDEFFEYAEYVKQVYTTKIKGKSSAGSDVTEETAMLSEIENVLLKHKKEYLK